MRAIGYFLAACIALAVLRAALAVLVAVYIILLIGAVLTKPAETFAMLGFFLLCFLLQEHAVATLTASVALCTVGAIAKRFEKTRRHGV